MSRVNEIARARAIQRLDLTIGKGVIGAGGRTFNVVYDDLLDLVQSVEMMMWKQTGKVLNPKFRPAITNRAALKIDVISGGDYSLYDGSNGPAPVPAFNPCDITDQLLRTHYLVVYINGNRWDNWFCRLDELAKCLYVIVKEAQEDAFTARTGVSMIESQRAPKRTLVAGAGHA